MKFFLPHPKAMPLPAPTQAEMDALIAKSLNLYQLGVWPVFGFGIIHEDPAWIDRRCGVMPAQHSRGG